MALDSSTTAAFAWPQRHLAFHVDFDWRLNKFVRERQVGVVGRHVDSLDQSPILFLQKKWSKISNQKPTVSVKQTHIYTYEREQHTREVQDI